MTDAVPNTAHILTWQSALDELVCMADPIDGGAEDARDYAETVRTHIQHQDERITEAITAYDSLLIEHGECVASDRRIAEAEHERDELQAKIDAARLVYQRFQGRVVDTNNQPAINGLLNDLWTALAAVCAP